MRPGKVKINLSQAWATINIQPAGRIWPARRFHAAHHHLHKYKLLPRIKLETFFLRSVYFTENSGYRSLKNRSCVTVFGSCSATLTVGEPLGDVSGSANHDFRTSVTGISGEIDTFFFLIGHLRTCRPFFFLFCTDIFGGKQTSAGSENV